MKNELILEIPLSEGCTIGGLKNEDATIYHLYTQASDLLVALNNTGQPPPERVNPRAHNNRKCLRGKTPKNIEDTVKKTPRQFAKFNRGLTASVKKVSFNLETRMASLNFGSKEDYIGGKKSPLYGFSDGMTTLTLLYNLHISAGEPDSLKNASVHIEVLEGETNHDLIGKISVARNTVKQVNQISIENYVGSYDWLKLTLVNTSFYDKIGWDENADTPVNVNDVSAVLNLFNPYWTRSGRAPAMSYRYKKKLVTLHQTDSNPDSEDAALQKYFRQTKFIAVDILRLYDKVMSDFKETSEVFDGKRKNEIYKKTFKLWNKSRPLVYDSSLTQSCSVPKSVWCPLISSLRCLVGENKKGELCWDQDPFKFWDKHKKTLIQAVLTHLKNMGGECGIFGKSDVPYHAMLAKAQQLLLGERK